MYKIDIKAISENTMVAAYVITSGSAARTVVETLDFTTGRRLLRFSQGPSTFSLSPIESSIGGKIMLGLGQNTPHEVMIYGRQGL